MKNNKRAQEVESELRDKRHHEGGEQMHSISLYGKPRKVNAVMVLGSELHPDVIDVMDGKCDYISAEDHAVYSVDTIRTLMEDGEEISETVRALLQDLITQTDGAEFIFVLSDGGTKWTNV
jgi:hypothetical protein